MCNIHVHSHPKILSDTIVLPQFQHFLSTKMAPESNLPLLFTASWLPVQCQWFSITSLHNKPKVGLNTPIFTFFKV